MEKRSLPLNFYCRSARLLLKKATFARKSNLFVDELRHLKKFSTLAFSVIPSHPEYEDEKGRKLAEDLEICMDDVRERIEELEDELSSASSIGCQKKSLEAGHSSEFLEKNDSWKKPIDKRQHIWERFARRLYEAAAWTPCFSTKVHPMGQQSTKLVSVTGQFRGIGRYASQSKESSSFIPKYERLLCGIPQISCISSPPQIHLRNIDEHEQKRDEGLVESRGSQGCFKSSSLRPQCFNKLTLVEREHTRSSDSQDTTKSELMAQITEASNHNLEDKLLNLQAIVMDMKDSVEGLKSRVEEEGKRWRGRADGLERKLRVLKDETEDDFNGFRHQVQDDMKKKLSEVSKELALARSEEQKKNLKQKFELMLESSTGEVEDFKNQVNQFVTQTQTMLMHGLEEKLSDSLSVLRADLKNDVNTLEIGISKDVDNLRQEMASRYESLLIDVEMGRIGEQQQINTFMKQRLANTHTMDADDVNKQLHALRADFQALSKEVSELNEEQKSETGHLKKHLQSFKTEAMQARVDAEVLLKDCELQLKEARHDLIELRGEQEDMKADLQNIKKLESQLTCEREHLKHLVDKVIVEDKQRTSSSEANPEDSPYIGLPDNLLVMGRVEKFSKLYTGCLDDLQTRMSRLETEHELCSSFAQDKVKVESSIVMIEKERFLASAAAAEAVAAASKAREMLQEAFGSFCSQMLNAKGKGNKLQNDVTLMKIQGDTTLAVSGAKKTREHCLKNAIHRLIRQMQEVFKRLTAVSCGGKKVVVKPGRKKETKDTSEGFISSVTSIESKIKVAAGIMSKLHERVHRLEDVQLDVGQCIEEVRMENRTLEKAASFWLPRYEATARLVMDVENRLCFIERKKTTPKGEDESDTRKRIGQQAQPGTSLTTNQSPFRSEMVKTDGTTSCSSSCQERLVLLEDRVEHIASATYANLRLLDAKVDHVSIGMRSALDIATETEDKCSALGAELVKLFRLILSARESPRKSDTKKSEPLLCPERGPQTPRSEVSSKANAGESYAPAVSQPAKPVKRINLRFGDKGTIISKVPI